MQFDYKAMEDEQMEGTGDTTVADYDQTQPLGDVATPHVHPTLQQPMSDTEKVGQDIITLSRASLRRRNSALGLKQIVLVPIDDGCDYGGVLYAG